MRKHSARKWLHFILDLLPVIILPVFAIYEINHDQNTPIEVEVEKYEIVDFNQLVPNSKKSSSSTVVQYLRVNEVSGIFEVGHEYFINFDVVNYQSQYYWCYGNPSAQPNSYGIGVTGLGNYSYIRTINDNNYNMSYFVRLTSGSTLIDIDNYFIVDLTQMFGVGNEPSVVEFKRLYVDNYYDYTSSHKELLDIGTETLNNTDIGSQMMYALYKPVKNYFNFNNVFNFGDIYQWFEVNIFHGTAPMSFFIVWNIVLYQFVMDLVFLIYGLFMWFIDMCEKLMDKPLNSIK